MVHELAPLGQHQRHAGVLVACAVHQQRHKAGGREGSFADNRAAHQLDAVIVGGRQEAVERRLGGTPARLAAIVAGAVERAIAATGGRTVRCAARRTEALQRCAA